MTKGLDWRSLFEPLGLRCYGKDGFFPATAEELKELRERCGASAFPPTFVEMATTLGNISFDNSVSFTTLSGEELEVVAFYGGLPDDVTLLNIYDIFLKMNSFPPHSVPFANDFGSTKFVFDSRSVLGPVSISAGHSGLIPIANSFDEFIMGLHIDSDD